MTDTHLLTTPLAITPQAMKDATKALRALVRESTGQDIAHSTMLNALTRGLGLGPHFSGMLHGLAHPTVATPQDAPTSAADRAPSPEALGSVVLVVLPTDRAETLAELRAEITQAFAAQDRGSWSLDDSYPLDGYEDDLVVWLSSPRRPEHLFGDGPVPKDKDLLAALAPSGDLSFLAPYLARHDALAILAPNLADGPSLSVDFRYKNTGQICTASVQEALWKAGVDADMCRITLLRAIGYDCEIADEAIEVIDARSDFGVLWQP